MGPPPDGAGWGGVDLEPLADVVRTYSEHLSEIGGPEGDPAVQGLQGALAALSQSLDHLQSESASNSMLAKPPRVPSASSLRTGGPRHESTMDRRKVSFKLPGGIVRPTPLSAVAAAPHTVYETSPLTTQLLSQLLGGGEPESRGSTPTPPRRTPPRASPSRSSPARSKEGELTHTRPHRQRVADQRLGVRRVESWRSHTEPLAEDDLHGGSNMAQLVCRRPLTEVEKPKVPPEKLDNQLEGLLETNLVLQNHIKRILTNSESFSSQTAGSFASHRLPSSFLTEEEAARSMTVTDLSPRSGAPSLIPEPMVLEARYANLWQEARELEARQANLQATCDQLELELAAREELYDMRLQEMEVCVETLVSANNILQSTAPATDGAEAESLEEALAAVQALATAQQQELLRLYRYVKAVDDAGLTQMLQLLDMETIQRAILEKLCLESATFLVTGDRSWALQQLHKPPPPTESVGFQTDTVLPLMEEAGVQTELFIVSQSSPIASPLASPVHRGGAYSPMPRSMSDLFGSDIVVERVVNNFDECDAESDHGPLRPPAVAPASGPSKLGSWRFSPQRIRSHCSQCPALQQEAAAAARRAEEAAEEAAQVRAELAAVAAQNRSLMEDLTASNACQAALEDGLRRGREEQQAWAEEREHLERQVEHLTRQHGQLKEHLRSVMADLEAVAVRREEEEEGATVAALEEARLTLAKEREENTRLHSQLRLLADSSVAGRDTLASVLAGHLAKVAKAERYAMCDKELRTALQALRLAVAPFLPAQDSLKTALQLPRTATITLQRSSPSPSPSPRNADGRTPRNRDGYSPRHRDGRTPRSPRGQAVSPRSRDAGSPRHPLPAQSSPQHASKAGAKSGGLERLSARGPAGAKAVP